MGMWIVLNQQLKLGI